MKQFFYKILFASILWLIVSSCAQMVAPTGGTKDITPPKIINETPPKETLNYKNETIELQFDEYVKLNQLSEELLISPPLKYTLRTKIKRKSLVLNIKDTLKEATTYVLNFGDAIVDITEGNPLSNYQYVFSTGNSIDSLSIKGQVVNAFDLKVEPKILVILYPLDAEDSVLMKEKPSYISRTDKEGRFSLNNIKAASYQLYALGDNNKNYLFDPAEAVAFMNQPIKISSDSTIDSLKLYLFKEEKPVQYIESRKEIGPKVQLNFKSELTNFQYSLVDTTDAILLNHTINEDKKSVVFWFKEMPKTKVEMIVKDDTLSNDTIKVEIDSLTSKMKLILESPLERKNPYYKYYKVEFNRPIASFDTAKIQLFSADSSRLTYEIKQDSIFSSIYYINANLLEDSSYYLILLEGAFMDIYHSSNDSIGQSFKIDNRGEYSEITVKIEADIEDAMILQLTNSKGEVLDWSVVGNKPIVFQHLKAGDYGLKLIFDKNENQQWDSGNLIAKRPPEKVWIYQEKITLRSNWDQEIKWVIKKD